MQPSEVFVDASFRNNEMRIAVVGINKEDNELIMHVRTSEFRDIFHAEIEAISWAQNLYPKVPIYSDCEVAAAMKSVNYIDRKSNKIAHLFSRVVRL